jgi:hypothetical protein
MQMDVEACMAYPNVRLIQHKANVLYLGGSYHLEVRSEVIRPDGCATSCNNAAFTRNPLGLLLAMHLHHYRLVASKRGRP